MSTIAGIILVLVGVILLINYYAGMEERNLYEVKLPDDLGIIQVSIKPKPGYYPRVYYKLKQGSEWKTMRVLRLWPTDSELNSK